MAYLVLVSGGEPGLVLPIDRDKTVLGRDPECHIVIEGAMVRRDTAAPRVSSVSRRHAVISRQDGKYFIEDGDGRGRQSRNGTFVNEQMATFPERVPLRDGDRIRICDFVCTFHQSQFDAEDVGEDQSLWPLVWVDMPYSAMPPRHREATDEELLTFITQLSQRVERSHIRAALPARLASQLRPRLLDPVSQERRRLDREFRRVIVLDATAGLDEGGTFVVDRFLEYAVRQCITAFGLELTHELHPEDLFQILKDESRSLICFLNAQHFPSVGMERLRGFTQTDHQCLMLLEESAAAPP